MTNIGGIVAGTPRLDRPTVLAVDGVDGSGKTTFAGALARALQEAGRVVHVVHLDDFLNPRVVRYRRGRQSPVGFFLDTYDLASFVAGVLDPLATTGSRTIRCRAFDHTSDHAVEEPLVAVERDAVVIVEGMFLHREELAERWDASVFLDVPFEVSVRRMAERDGSDPDPEHPSMRRYVEGQRLYLSACRPEQRATWVVVNH